MNKRYYLELRVLGIFFLFSCLMTIPYSQTSLATAEKEAYYESLTIPSPSLGDTLIENDITQKICVILPNGYDTRNQYPVLYFLPAWGEEIEDVRSGLLLHSRNKLNNTIIVIIDGYHEDLIGIIYGNSPVAGYWEDYIIKDLIPYIDQNFPTINSSDARGITGFYKGGLGCLSLACKYPGYFGAVYAVNPTIYIDNSIENSPLGNELDWERLNAFQNEMLAYIGTTTSQEEIMTEYIGKLHGITAPNTKFLLSYGITFAYNLTKEGVYFDFLYTKNGTDLAIDFDTYPRWENGGANFTLKIKRALTINPELKLGLHYGYYEPNAYIKESVADLSEKLAAEEITHQLDITANNDPYSDNRFEIYYNVTGPFFQDYLREMEVKTNNLSGFPLPFLLLGGFITIIIRKKKNS